MNINLKPSFKYNLFKFLIYTILTLFVVYILKNYYMDVLKPLFKIKNNPFSITDLSYYFIGLLFIKMLFTTFVQKVFNNYQITKKSINIREGIMKNKINIPINGRLIIESKQNFFQLFIGLIDIELEADGDSSSPEGIMKNVNSSIYDLLEDLKSGDSNNYY